MKYSIMEIYITIFHYSVLNFAHDSFSSVPYFEIVEPISFDDVFNSWAAVIRVANIF